MSVRKAKQHKDISYPDVQMPMFTLFYVPSTRLNRTCLESSRLDCCCFLNPSFRREDALPNNLWRVVDHGTGSGEVARPAAPPLPLVVAVERVRGVGDHGVGLEARSAGLYGAAVRAVGTRVVQRCQQPRVAGRRIRHAPAHVRVTGASWFVIHDVGGAVEVARRLGPAVALVVAVERIRGVREPGVGLEARRAGLDGAAVGAVAARVLQRRLQPRVPGGRVRHAPAGHQRAAPEVELVHLRPVRVEQPEVLLDVVRPVALLVLVEEGEDVDVHVGVGVVRGARVTGQHALDQVVVVRLRVGYRSRFTSSLLQLQTPPAAAWAWPRPAAAFGFAAGRPPALRNVRCWRHGFWPPRTGSGRPQLLHREVRGVELGVQEAVVHEPGHGVAHAGGVGVPQGVVEGDLVWLLGVREERVGVHGEVRPGPLQEIDHGLHHRPRDVVPEPARGRRACRWVALPSP
uniref:Uncharacterized protein n=1 Tax=Zea mays TaxID=4577 RepID=B7ZZB8_MAIZE|nr:unknown [Zea mays]